MVNKSLLSDMLRFILFVLNSNELKSYPMLAILVTISFPSVVLTATFTLSVL